MRTKFQAPREPNEEERTFIGIMEKYGESTIDGLCQIIFGEKHNSKLERKLRKIREMYHNFLFTDVIPQGRIIKARTGYGNPCYKLIREKDEDQRRIHLNIELDLVCAAIEKHNTRKIWGDIQHNGQQFMALNDYDKMIEYRNWLEEELK